ncbi:hypothetical protein [Micromonospora andamanensis]|uniref:hypothetical protein n=1 Tax=Micromonospora andamanensis TaxID=1287068 RepID=UPI0019507E21|nr:hypothetical protein [Micromonospora andamanensis]
MGRVTVGVAGLVAPARIVRRLRLGRLTVTVPLTGLRLVPRLLTGRRLPRLLTGLRFVPRLLTGLRFVPRLRA